MKPQWYGAPIAPHWHDTMGKDRIVRWPTHKEIQDRLHNFGEFANLFEPEAVALVGPPVQFVTIPKRGELSMELP